MKTRCGGPAHSGPCTGKGDHWQGGKAGQQRGSRRG